MKCTHCGGSGEIGFECVECHRDRPPEWFIYEAHHKATGEIVKPLCASCVKGALGESTRFTDGNWKHIGPLNQ